MLGIINGTVGVAIFKSNSASSSVEMVISIDQLQHIPGIKETILYCLDHDNQYVEAIENNNGAVVFMCGLKLKTMVSVITRLRSGGIGFFPITDSVDSIEEYMKLSAGNWKNYCATYGFRHMQL